MAKEQKLDELLENIGNKVAKMDPFNIDELPNVSLYMDQLTTLMDGKLRNTLRHPSEDKVLTKTMINNYAKNDLIPPPHNKKYSKDHIYELIFIFYFKNFLSIGDIQTLLSPLTVDFFAKDKDFGLEEIYKEIAHMGKGARARLQTQIEANYKLVEDAFPNVTGAKREYLRKFAFICELGYDIFLKKYIMEQMIDEISEEYVIERESAYDDELLKKVAKEATHEAKRIAKIREAHEKEKARQEKVKNEKTNPKSGISSGQSILGSVFRNSL